MAWSDLVYIDETGYHYADYEAVVAELEAEYKAIFGEDVYLAADSKDGQMLAVFATAIYDMFTLGQSIYNSFSPATAQGAGLSRIVKINGISRRAATYSTVDLLITGLVGTNISNGKAQDEAGQIWNLPPSVLIPEAGEITVTATAEIIGAVRANAETINKIYTPTLGWLSVNNLLDATVGVPVESDGELRIRQAISTANPSLSVANGTQGAIADLENVIRVAYYENDTDEEDANGLPPHSISFIVDGGDAQEIGNTIALRKTPGTETYGTTSVNTYDIYGVLNVINFYRPTLVNISVEITLTPLAGWDTEFETTIKTQVAALINSLNVGNDVYLSKIYTPANLTGTPEGETYDITLIRIKKNDGSYGTSNITVAFNELAVCAVEDVEFIVS